MKLSLVVLLGVFSSSSSESATYQLAVKKFLNNGDPVGTTNTITITGSVENDEKTCQVDYNIAEEAKDVTIYFANDAQEITEVIITDGKMQAKKYKKPWNLAQDFGSTDVAGLSTTQGPLKIPLEYLISDITKVSASITNPSDIILNYYGIKNNLISEQDRYVLGSYMVADLTLLSN